MGWFFGGNDRQLAETKYADRESATESAGRARRSGHRNGGATRAARKGQSWDDKDRDRETGRRTRWGGR